MIFSPILLHQNIADNLEGSAKPRLRSNSKWNVKLYAVVFFSMTISRLLLAWFLPLNSDTSLPVGSFNNENAWRKWLAEEDEWGSDLYHNATFDQGQRHWHGRDKWKALDEPNATKHSGSPRPFQLRRNRGHCKSRVDCTKEPPCWASKMWWSQCNNRLQNMPGDSIVASCSTSNRDHLTFSLLHLYIKLYHFQVNLVISLISSTFQS